jgi:hypothetical protein
LANGVLAPNNMADRIASNTPGAGIFGYRLTELTLNLQCLIITPDQPAP